MKLRLATPGILIDIGRIDELKGVSAVNGSVRIGALTTHATIAASDLVPVGLAEAAGMVGDPQVRNVGTIGGNVAHADPVSDLPIV
jgi:carbon-monoxide dehydrogenase medium subunit